MGVHQPGGPGLGKQQSSTLVPDGVGVDAVPVADLRNLNLTMAYLIGTDLTNARFSSATLTDADLTGAEVRGTSFSSITSKGFSASQLYSTASYQAQDLTGIGLAFNDLSGWDFAGQNLTNASFLFATLTNADLSQANLTNADFLLATLTDADLAGADLRGAKFADLTGAVVTNLIESDGSIAGLQLSVGQMLLVRDYDGNPDAFPAPTGPIPINVEQHFIMDTGGILQLRFEADPWDSMISFEPGIPVSLEGTLSLDFASGVELASQVGRTLDLFDWTGVVPTGVFTVESPYTWDLSDLYSTGEVTLVAVPEPCSALLLCVGGMAFLAGRRRS